MKSNRIIFLLLIFSVFISCGAVSAGTITLANALDNNQLTWTNSGWSGQSSDSNDGIDVANSYVFATDLLENHRLSESKYFETTVQGPGTITFYWSNLHMYMGGGNGYFIFGERKGSDVSNIKECESRFPNYSQVSYRVGPGTHKLVWLLHASSYSGQFYSIDAFVDQVTWKADDSAAPKIVSTIPKKSAKKVSRTSNIYIKFNEKIQSSVNWSKITVKKNGKNVSIKKWIAGNKLVIKTSKRTKNSYYTVYIPKSAIKDAAYNNFAKGYVFKFKTN